MPRYVGYLVTIIAIAGRCYVARILIGILKPCGKGHIAQRLKGALGSNVDAFDVYAPQVEYGPSKLLPLGVSHNLVVHRIIIGVGLQAGMSHKTCGPVFFKHKASIILHGALRAQQGVAHVGVVEVVEGGHTIAALGKGPEAEHRLRQGLPTNKQRRAVGGAMGHGVQHARVVFHPLSHHRGLCLQAAEVDGGGHRCTVGIAMRKGKVGHIGVQLIPAKIVAGRKAPLWQQLIHIGRREV